MNNSYQTDNSYTRFKLLTATLMALALSACVTHQPSVHDSSDSIIISVLGTNDVHGQILPQSGRGGLTVLSGYVNALRTARSAGNGAVLLIDAGDMWQGTLESNMSEGAAVLDAYNKMAYTAATIGNHEFDFGPAGALATPKNDGDDARGALKKRAAEADFPLLAANLIDLQTQLPVAWPNVQPSVMINVSGVKVGIIGVMTIGALEATMAANTKGLRVAPLAETIAYHARKLRSMGAQLVIVTAHAGGSCNDFDNPLDLSSCDPDDEIMQVARALPPNLVDHIIAGHQHRGIAHTVNGVAITASFSSTRALSRVDFILDKNSGAVRARNIFPPQRLCPYIEKKSQTCAWDDDNSGTVVPATYAGFPVVPDTAVLAIANRAAAGVEQLKAERIGIYLDTPITLKDRPESALGNLMTDALLEFSKADVALHNVVGGIRADLPQGDLLFGSVYQMFPFDNRLVIIEVSGLELRRIIENQVHNQGRRAGFSGMRVFVNCDGERMLIDMQLTNGRNILDTDRVKLAVNDFLALGGDNVLTPAMPSDGFKIADDTPLARDVIVQWLKNRGGRLNAHDFLDQTSPRWNLPDTVAQSCSLQ